MATMYACHPLAQARPYDVVHLTSVNKSRQGKGFYSQTNLPGLIPRTRRETLLEKEVFAMPYSLSTGPLIYRHYGFLRMLYVEHYRTVSFAYLILRRNIRQASRMVRDCTKKMAETMARAVRQRKSCGARR